MRQPNKLRITELQFNELYPDLVGYYDHFNNPVPYNIAPEVFEQRYLSSKLWRLNNIYTVIDKSGVPVIFRMNLAQHIVYAKSRQHPRIIILKSRQQGISTFWLVSYFDDAIMCSHLHIGLMAQGTDEASTLLERVKFLWESLDEDVKGFSNTSLCKDNAKAFSFTNGSTMFIRVSFRSTTLQRLHVSEFGKIANAYPIRAKEVKTGTLQALAKGNTGVIESTAEGRNMFQEMWDTAVIAIASGEMTTKDFYPIFLSWLDDPDCELHVPQVIDTDTAKYFLDLETETGRKLTNEQKNFWIAQRRELGGDIFQEYPATPKEAFTAAKDGTYYSRAYREHIVQLKRLIPGLYDPNLPIDVYFDMGVDDYTCMGFRQWHNGMYRIVHEYWNNGYDLEHYIDYAIDTGYEIRSFVFPHDIAQRQLVSGRASGGKARTRLETIRDYIDSKGKYISTHVVAKMSIEDGIANVRRMLKMLMIDPKCEYIISCLLNYSKEWDEKLRSWKNIPLHDEFSHGADMLKYMASHTIEDTTHHKSRMDVERRKRYNGTAL